MRADPKSTKRQLSCKSFIVLLGPALVKAALRTLMKLTPGLNFINVLRTAFSHVEPKSVKKTVKLSVFLRFRNLRAQKLRVNMLVKLTEGS